MCRFVSAIREHQGHLGRKSNKGCVYKSSSGAKRLFIPLYTASSSLKWTCVNWMWFGSQIYV